MLLCSIALAAKAANPDLRVGTTGDYPPFSFIDTQTGQYQGSDIDQARALAAALHRRLVFVPTSWGTLSADLSAGRFDIAMGGVSVNPQRAAQGVFTAAYLHDGKTPVVRCDEVSWSLLGISLAGYNIPITLALAAFAFAAARKAARSRR